MKDTYICGGTISLAAISKNDSSTQVNDGRWLVEVVIEWKKTDNDQLFLVSWLVCCSFTTMG